MKKNYILITIEEFVKLTKNKLSKFACEQLFDWIYCYEYRVAVMDDKILMEDTQVDDEDVMVFDISKFLEYWIYTLENKYDYSENSFDRAMCGNEFIDGVAKLILELKNV